MASSGEHYGAGRRGKGCAIGAAIIIAAVALLALAGYLYDRRWQRKVEAKLAEYRAAGQPVTWEDVLALRARIPEDENAALVLTDAFSRMARPSNGNYESAVEDLWQRADLGRRPSEVMHELLRSRLEANAEALQLIHKAAGFEQGCFPLERATDPYATGFPHLSQLPHAEDLCALQAQFYAAQSDGREAMRVLSDIHILPASLADAARDFEASTRVTVDSMWLEAIERTLALCRPPSEGLQRLRRRLACEEAQLNLASAFYGERAAGHWVFSSPAATAQQIGVWSGASPQTAWRFARIIRAAPGLVGRDAVFFLATMDRAASVANLPLRRHPPEGAKLSRDVSEALSKPGYAHLISSLVMPSVGRAFEEEVNVRARLRVACTVLAVEEWRARHGAWPESLGQLVPDLLDAVPEDPFSDGAVLYARTSDGIIVYSTAEDGRDNGGATMGEVMMHAEGAAAPTGGWDLPFHLLNPELRGTPPLTFHDELMGSGVQSSALERSGLTRQKLSELGLSEEDPRKLGFE